jgi:Ca2+-binding RTX toxin-like protein
MQTHPASTVITGIPFTTDLTNTLASPLTTSTSPFSGHAYISGDRALGQTLTASNDFVDSSGGTGTLKYAWQGSSNGFYNTTYLGSGLTLVQTAAMLNLQIRLIASYTNAQGQNHTMFAVEGTTGADILSINQNSSDSYLNGLDGNDRFYIGSVSVGDDIYNGGNGSDTVDYSSEYANSVTVNLGLTTAQHTVGTKLDTFLSIENVYGSRNHTNNLTGNAADNTLSGGDGNDTLSGGGGNDTLSGYEGNDKLDGGAGTDTVVFITDLSAKGVTVNLSLTTPQNTIGAGIDTLLNIENVTGTLYDDTLTGTSGNNVLLGGGGNDTLSGGGGNDTLDGGAGSDTATYDSAAQWVAVNLALTTAQNTHGAGTDTLLNIENVTGSAYNDTLLGNTGANTLFGGAGNDLLAGGLGNDTLTGGAGQDTFAFNSTLGAGNIDTLTDFNVANDTIRLSKGIFTTLTTPGVLAAAAFKILGNGGVEDSTDHLLYNTATGALSYDADGSGAGAAVQIAILGTGLAMTNADFMVA